MSESEERPAEGGPQSAETAKQEVLAEVRQAVRAAREGGTDAAQSIDDLPPTSQLGLHERAQDIRLKKVYAWTLLGMMGVQILIADTVFFIYAEWGVDWRFPPGVITGWLSATVVEVIGVVLVVTRSLFPRRDLS